MLVIIVLVVTILCIFLWYNHKKKQNVQSKSTNISLDYSLGDDIFHIEGEKGHFQITKNNRFSFIVENGEISSFIDKSASDTPICYKGDENGN